MEVDAQDGPAAGWTWDAAPPATPEPSKGHDFKVLGVNVHVPGETKPRLDENIATVGGVGIAPEDALMAGMAAKGIAKATTTGGMIAGLKEAVKNADPIVKFEVTRRALRSAGVPDGAAEIIAFGISGYRRGAKTPTPSSPDSPHLDLSARVPAGGLTQQQIAERLAAARTQGMAAPAVEPQMSPRPSPSNVPAMPPKPAPVAEPPPVEAPTPAAIAPFNGPRLVPSPQKLANDLGIAAKRAGVTVTAADDVAVLQAVRGGADPATAIADVVAAKAPADPAAELARRFGLPSDAERTFPPNKSGLPTKAPKADAAAKIQAVRERAKK